MSYEKTHTKKNTIVQGVKGIQQSKKEHEMADRKCIVHVARNGLLNAHTRENTIRKKMYKWSKITLTDFRSAGWLNDTAATDKTLENESRRLLDHLRHAAELRKNWLMPIHIKAFWYLMANSFHAKKTQ